MKWSTHKSLWWVSHSEEALLNFALVGLVSLPTIIWAIIFLLVISRNELAAPYAGGSGAIAALGSGGPTLAYGDSATEVALAYADKKPSFPIKAPPLAAPVETPGLTFWAQGVGAWGKNLSYRPSSTWIFATSMCSSFDHWDLKLPCGYAIASMASAMPCGLDREEPVMRPCVGWAGPSFESPSQKS